MEEIKQLLLQYNSLLKEKESVKNTIDKLEKRIAIMESQGYTEKDSVTGGNGGKQHFVVEGFPYPEYSAKKTLLLLRKAQQEKLLGQIEEQIVSVEHYISQIHSSTLRRMITFRYIDGYSWLKVAQNMGKKYTAESCRKTVERYLKEN